MKAASMDSLEHCHGGRRPGGVLGMTVATAYHLLHDHSRLPLRRSLLPHFIPQLIAGGIGGALVIGWAAVFHDRQRQARKDRTRSHRAGSERPGMSRQSYRNTCIRIA